jgi:hypothetical protein
MNNHVAAGPDEGMLQHPPRRLLGRHHAATPSIDRRSYTIARGVQPHLSDGQRGGGPRDSLTQPGEEVPERPHLQWPNTRRTTAAVAVHGGASIRRCELVSNRGAGVSFKRFCAMGVPPVFATLRIPPWRRSSKPYELRRMRNATRGWLRISWERGLGG